MTLYVQLNTQPSCNLNSSPSVSFAVELNTYPNNQLSPEFTVEVSVEKQT
jgi:hypothetical protein